MTSMTRTPTRATTKARRAATTVALVVVSLTTAVVAVPFPDGDPLSSAASSSADSLPAATTTATNDPSTNATTTTVAPSPSSSPTPAAGTPLALPTIPDFSYMGCFQDHDESPARVLPFHAGDGLDNPACAALCYRWGYPVAGTEAGGQCFCGSGMSLMATSESCTLPCTSDPTQPCGGPSALTAWLSNINPPLYGPINPVLAGFGYLGCYKDSAASRAFHLEISFGYALEGCTSECRARGLPIAAGELGGRCFCGAEGDFDALTPAPEDECDARGVMMSFQKFGGLLRLSVYADTTVPTLNVTVVPPAQPTNTPVPIDGPPAGVFTNDLDYYYAGCFRDAPSRLLPVSYTAAPATQHSCAAGCFSLGYDVSGTEAGNECWCGGSDAFALVARQAIIPSTECSTVCDAATNQSCGGTWAATVFVAQRATPPAGFHYLACFTDGDANGGGDGGGKRRLPFHVGDGYDNAACTAACTRWGYPVAGTEYGGQCWCGSGMDLLQTSAACSMPCGTNPSQTCGGEWALSAWQADTLRPAYGPINPVLAGFAYVGCYKDSAAARAFRTKVGWGYALEGCTYTCREQGFAFAAAELAGQCYCGGAAEFAALTPAAEDECDARGVMMPFQKFGGVLRMSVYVDLAATDAVANVTIVPPALPASAAAADPPAGVNTTDYHFYYAGCFRDTEARILPVAATEGPLNQHGCAAHCLGRGYEVSGTEYGSECWCGDQDVFVSSAQKIAESECGAPCAAAQEEVCGGTWAATVFVASY